LSIIFAAGTARATAARQSGGRLENGTARSLVARTTLRRHLCLEFLEVLSHCSLSPSQGLPNVPRYITTLQRVIKAMGGGLEIRAVFPNGVVRISQFQDLRKRA